MNKRIRELAEQADSYALATIGDLWIGWEEKNPGWEDCRDQKFAELIVCECMSIYSKIDNGNLHLGTDNYLEALHKTFRS